MADSLADERSAKALAERIADYVETAHTYSQWSKREAMVEAVRIACEDAQHETLSIIRDGELDVLAVAEEAYNLLREVWAAGNAEGRLAELFSLAGRLDALIDGGSRD